MSVLTLTTEASVTACSSRLKSALSVLLQVLSCRNSLLWQNSHLEGLPALIRRLPKGTSVT